MTMRSALGVLLVVGGAAMLGCDGNSGGTGGGGSGGTGSNSSSTGSGGSSSADGGTCQSTGATFTCGDVMCDRTCEICVMSEIEPGPDGMLSTFMSCAPLPDACHGVASCACAPSDDACFSKCSGDASTGVYTCVIEP